jgi:hypothetical protein
MASHADKKAKADHIAKQIEHAQAMIVKMNGIIADPETTTEDLEEAETTLNDMNKKLEKLTGVTS